MYLPTDIGPNRQALLQQLHPQSQDSQQTIPDMLRQQGRTNVPGVTTPGTVQDLRAYAQLPPPGSAPQAAPDVTPKKRTPATIDSLMPNLRQNYHHTPQDLQRAYQERPEWFEGAQIFGSKGDKIRFADGKEYDVINAAGAGGRGWQELWDNDPNAVRAPQMPAGGGFMGPLMAGAQAGGLAQQLQGDPTSRIQQALAPFTQGRGPNIEALLAQLAQG